MEPRTLPFDDQYSNVLTYRNFFFFDLIFEAVKKQQFVWFCCQKSVTLQKKILHHEH
jgi:hypothetical protein